MTLAVAQTSKKCQHVSHDSMHNSNGSRYFVPVEQFNCLLDGSFFPTSVFTIRLLFHQVKSVLIAVSQENLLWWRVVTATFASMHFD